MIPRPQVLVAKPAYSTVKVRVLMLLKDMAKQPLDPTGLLRIQMPPAQKL
jgi:hypothetical protein